MQQIREYFGRMVTLSDSEWELFSSKLERKEFAKKEDLLKAGQTEGYLSFLEKGIVRYFIAKELSDLTFDFGFENEFVCAYDSFLTRQPSFYHIEALADTVVWRLAYADLQEVYRQSAVGNTIGRLAAEQLYLRKSKREKSLLYESAEERYQKLFTEQARLIHQIPLKYIASYIGITPQALSRIRQRIT